MKASELRIGNFVYQGSTYGIRKVSSFEIYQYDLLGKGGTVAEYYKDWQPIPLTPEILLKCGFTKTGDDIDNGSFYQYQKGGFRMWFSNYIPHNGWVNIDNEDNAGKYRLQPVFFHLHELQNIFYAIAKSELIEVL